MKQKLDAEDKNKSDLRFYQQMPWFFTRICCQDSFRNTQIFLIPFYRNWKEDA